MNSTLPRSVDGKSGGDSSSPASRSPNDSKCMHEGGFCQCTGVCKLRNIKTRHTIKIDAMTSLVLEPVGKKISLSVTAAGITVFTKASDPQTVRAIVNAAQLCINSAEAVPA